MEAKDTVMDLDEYNRFTKEWYRERGIPEAWMKADCLGAEYKDTLKHQAEISFKAGQESVRKEWNDAMDLGLREAYKAGIKEVVDCEDKVGWYDTSCGKRVFCVPEDYRNGKLKEWDIK